MLKTEHYKDIYQKLKETGKEEFSVKDIIAVAKGYISYTKAWQLIREMEALGYLEIISTYRIKFRLKELTEKKK